MPIEIRYRHLAGVLRSRELDAVTFTQFRRTVIAVSLTSRLDDVTFTHCLFTRDS